MPGNKFKLEQIPDERIGNLPCARHELIVHCIRKLRRTLLLGIERK
jgi:hypothetical protein